MSDDAKRLKPTGITGPIAMGPAGVQHLRVEFPGEKAAIEQVIAAAFCAGKAGLRQQINRYGGFRDLVAQPENSIDFKVETDRGTRWLELAEFAPLHEFGGRYENTPNTWPVDLQIKLLTGLIEKKCRKGYGSDVILVIYKTHRQLAIPPMVLRTMRNQLLRLSPSFESIYFLSPHSLEEASVFEIWPGDPNDDGPILSEGTVHHVS